MHITHYITSNILLIFDYSKLCSCQGTIWKTKHLPYRKHSFANDTRIITYRGKVVNKFFKNFLTFFSIFATFFDFL